LNVKDFIQPGVMEYVFNMIAHIYQFHVESGFIQSFVGGNEDSQTGAGNILKIGEIDCAGSSYIRKERFGPICLSGIESSG